MPEIDIFGNKAITLLSASVILLVALLFSIKHARKLYWDTNRLTKRSKVRQKSERPKVIRMIGAATICAMGLLLAVIIHPGVGTGFAIVSMIAMILFTLPGNRRYNQTRSNDADGYVNSGSPNSSGDCSDGAGDSDDC